MGHKTIGSITIFEEDIKDITYATTMIMEIIDAEEVTFEGT